MFKNWLVNKIVAIMVIFFSPIFLNAQIKSFTIKQSPENPNPGELITFNLSSFSFNIDLAKITWKLDNKIIKEGVGQKNASINAPANGKTSSLEVEVLPQGDTNILRQFAIIAPADLDILWEAVDSYTPPFYKGKALPINQAQIKVVAIPVVKSQSGSYIKPENFVYSWKKDLKNFPANGGLAKNSFVFNNEILDKQNMVNITASDGTRNVSGGVVISFFEPDILFYEVDQQDLLPKYQKTLSGSFRQSRLNVIVEPYFVSSNFKTNNDIMTKWNINGQEFKSDTKNTLSINTAGTTGNLSISFFYEDIRKLFRKFDSSQSITILR